MGGVATGGTPTGATAAAAIAKAIKASGAIVRVQPRDFMSVLQKIAQPLVVIAEGGLFKTNYQYLTGYKGLVFFTKSSTPSKLVRNQKLYSGSPHILCGANRDGRVCLHYGMSIMAAPLFRDAVHLIGRLISLQGKVSVAQVRTRIYETWGERSTLDSEVFFTLQTTDSTPTLMGQDEGLSEVEEDTFESFTNLLKIYEASRYLQDRAQGGLKAAYSDKGMDARKKAAQWLYENMGKVFSVR